MAREKKHEVRVSLQVLSLSKAGSAICLEVFAEGTKLGTMEIGHGSIGWRPYNKRRMKRIPWSSFAELMERTR